MGMRRILFSAAAAVISALAVTGCAQPPAGPVLGVITWPHACIAARGANRRAGRGDGGLNDAMARLLEQRAR